MAGIAMYGVIVMGLAVWSLARPAVAFALVFFMFALDQWATATASRYLPSTEFTNYLVAGLIGLAALNLFVFGGARRIFNGPAFSLVFALYLYAFISVSWSPAGDKALEIWQSNYPYLVLFLGISIIIIQNVEDAEEFLKAILIFGLPFLFMLNFILEWQLRSFVYDGKVVRLPLTLGQFGGYVLITAALLNMKGALWIALRILCVALGILLIIKTGSRGQLFAAVLCVGMLLVLGERRLSFKQVAMSFVVGLVFVVSTYFVAIQIISSDPTLSAGQERWSPAGMGGDTEFRSQMITRLIDAWQASPETMLVGLGNSAGYDPRITDCIKDGGCYPHNVPVEILTEEGIFGFIIYLLLIIIVLLKVFILLSSPVEKSSDRNVIKCIIAFAFFEFMLSMKQGSLLANWPFFLLLLLLDRLIDFSREQRKLAGDQRTDDSYEWQGLS